MAALSELGFDSDKIQKCAESSFGKFFEEDRGLWAQVNSAYIPAVTINNITYRGRLDAEEIFGAICAGFKDRPDECRSSYKPLDTFLQEHGVVFWIFIAILGNVVLILTIIGAYRACTKQKDGEQLEMQVNSAVSQYFKLNEYATGPGKNNALGP